MTDEKSLCVVCGTILAGGVVRLHCSINGERGDADNG